LPGTNSIPGEEFLERRGKKIKQKKQKKLSSARLIVCVCSILAAQRHVGRMTTN
jgi:hypothetical protein